MLAYNRLGKQVILIQVANKLHKVEAVNAAVKQSQAKAVVRFFIPCLVNFFVPHC